MKAPIEFRQRARSVLLALLAATCCAAAVLAADAMTAQEDEGRFAPPPDERQLPRAMHSAMDRLPSISVGQETGDLVGADHRVLQAAVDYVAGLGGGTVEIGAGTYDMRDSLHLRSGVTVRGVREKTILRKAKAFESALALDGDFGEEQVTLVDPSGFA
ncbi:MAG: hypothetical protein JXA90_08355, partial [Planctomycetes bacterium]|nr:hypothetical protein [Planctomycetota bacterium]